MIYTFLIRIIKLGVGKKENLALVRFDEIYFCLYQRSLKFYQ